MSILWSALCRFRSLYHCCHSLSLIAICRHSLCHSLSLVAICLSLAATRCTTCFHSLYHSLSLILPLVVARCHSLLFVVTRCTTRLSFCKWSYKIWKYIKIMKYLNKLLTLCSKRVQPSFHVREICSQRGKQGITSLTHARYSWQWHYGCRVILTFVFLRSLLYVTNNFTHSNKGLRRDATWMLFSKKKEIKERHSLAGFFLVKPFQQGRIFSRKKTLKYCTSKYQVLLHMSSLDIFLYFVSMEKMLAVSIIFRV